MINDTNKIYRLKESFNNQYDTDELLWLLRGNENLTAKEFICKYILNVAPENMINVFEEVE